MTLDSRKTVDVTIPKGTEDGHKLRLRGLGQHGPGGDGDAIFEINVSKHPYFTRKGKDIYLDVPISLSEAVFGGKVTVPTLDGSVSLALPKGSNSGKVMRLKGKGVPQTKGAVGDMYVKLQIVLPKDMGSLEKVLEKWSTKFSYKPRAW